jgi:hypothetical protein
MRKTLTTKYAEKFALCFADTLALCVSLKNKIDSRLIKNDLYDTVCLSVRVAMIDEENPHGLQEDLEPSPNAVPHEGGPPQE